MRTAFGLRAAAGVVLVAVLSFLASSSAEKAAKARDLYELTPNNFDSRVEKGSWLIMLGASWCGHCQRAKPAFKEAGKQTREKAAKDGVEAVKFAYVDADKYKSLATRFGVNGFPTFWYLTANGTDARRAHVSSYTAESFAYYAEKGWKKDAPAERWSSPMGPFGKAKFYAFLGIDKVLALQEPIAKATGAPGPVVAFLLMLVAVAGMTMSLMACAVWLGPTNKRAPVQKPVRLSEAAIKSSAPPATLAAAAPASSSSSSSSNERKED